MFNDTATLSPQSVISARPILSDLLDEFIGRHTESKCANYSSKAALSPVTLLRFKWAVNLTFTVNNLGDFTALDKVRVCVCVRACVRACVCVCDCL